MLREETLDMLAVGEEAVITALRGEGVVRRRLVALGFAPGGRVSAVQESPWGDPVAYRVCGAVIALRRADARDIVVKRM